MGFWDNLERFLVKDARLRLRNPHASWPMTRDEFITLARTAYPDLGRAVDDALIATVFQEYPEWRALLVEGTIQ